MLPFAVPILLTFALVLLVGDKWPRDIASGSGLKLAGLCCAAVTSLIVSLCAVGQLTDRRVRAFGGILCAATGLLGWPVWSTGVLPSINGAALSEPIIVPMTLERTETTHKSKSRDLYHWAWLRAQDDDSLIASGRYFVSETVFERLNTLERGTVGVTVAKGLLGAQVVIGFDQS